MRIEPESFSSKYSYRDDPSVPNFPDNGPLVVMDAQCALCSKGAIWIADNDVKQEFRIVPAQSNLGQSLLTHFKLDPLDPVSWLYLEQGIAYMSLDAFIRVGMRLGGRWKAFGILRALPKALQDVAYRFVAQRRYQVPC